MSCVLLVEDDDLLRGLLKSILITSGYEVCEAFNGATVDEMYCRTRPDLVITDLIMPEKDGLEVIVDLRRKDPRVKIVAISGGGRFDAECHLMIAQKLGAQQTLAKPFGNAEFLDTVRCALEGDSKNQSLPRLRPKPVAA